MIIECPACSKKFNIDEKLIPDEGRLLKCGNCEHTWFFKSEEKNKQDPETSKISEIEENKSKLPDGPTKKNRPNRPIKTPMSLK